MVSLGGKFAEGERLVTRAWEQNPGGLHGKCEAVEAQPAALGTVATQLSGIVTANCGKRLSTGATDTSRVSYSAEGNRNISIVCDSANAGAIQH